MLDDAGAWSYHSIYIWWFCLRLVLWPVIQLVDAAAQQQAAAEIPEGQATDEQTSESNENDEVNNEEGLQQNPGPDVLDRKEVIRRP